MRKIISEQVAMSFEDCELEFEATLDIFNVTRIAKELSFNNHVEVYIFEISYRDGIFTKHIEYEIIKDKINDETGPLNETA